MNVTRLQNLIGLDGKVVIISGAGGGGMGTAATRLIAEAGATVVAVDRSAESLEKHVAPLRAEGLAVVPFVADVLSNEGVASIMQKAKDADGELHGLVTIVGGATGAHWGASTRISRDTWHDLLSWNLDSMFFITQAVAAELKAQKRPGSLVSISSISGLTAAVYHIGYGAAKAAIFSVARTLALELASSGIRVNSIAPGAVATPASGIATDAGGDGKVLPMARPASPEEIAATALFLLTDMAGYITGQCITVDGGVSLKWAHLDENNCPGLVKDRTFLEAIMK